VVRQARRPDKSSYFHYFVLITSLVGPGGGGCRG